ncbi:MAG: L,D-transpeptidase [Hoeflea sp.]|uniref:L,D-transpeptidase n=1 Tax=Hoeflea sp. TaxID=1940281 RepID=UPI001D81365E|nr:L,D-transpeptidase [Hoeflea sp.]MBU4531088.1 L,D-transpeptidase [Alphaproteobacteria bacterium]MBU4542863.1 L,D-transpeptidase [Alphaproteobacteria bacterium]MBU4552675.1 L,D-transpeptidase [Alphaproteobacteria bacterium]MBV1722980.1 L,D-transpeptidase [Hoeflea sp.]MBV1762891.1 L,D-transpeptidase [Hoeflea sp.]
MRNLFFVGLLALALMPFSSASALAAKLVAKVDISTQTMVVTHNGKVKYKWRVSTGRKGYSTPTGTYSAKWLSRHHRSRKYNNAPMPYAVFYHGGYAVHGTYETNRLGRPASRGCVRLAPEHAAKFFSLVQQTGNSNTRIVITR